MRPKTCPAVAVHLEKHSIIQNLMFLIIWQKIDLIKNDAKGENHIGSHLIVHDICHHGSLDVRADLSAMTKPCELFIKKTAPIKSDYFCS